MTLPVHFATLRGGHQALSLFDRQFAAIGRLVTIPCHYASPDGNTITLTPFDDTPVQTRYTDLVPQFVFVATQTNTAPVTINVIGSAHDSAANEMSSQPPGAGFPPAAPTIPLGGRPAFKLTGQAIAAGDIVANGITTAIFAQALNSGNGGFALSPVAAAAGVTNGVAAAPGEVGEFLTGNAPINVAIFTGVQEYFAQPLTLPPGDWDIQASFYGPGLNAEAIAVHQQPIPPGVVPPFEGNIAVIPPALVPTLRAQVNTNRTQALVSVSTPLPFVVTVRNAGSTSAANLHVTARRMR